MTTDQAEAVAVARGILTALTLTTLLAGLLIGLTARHGTPAQAIGPALVLASGLLLVRIAKCRGWAR